MSSGGFCIPARSVARRASVHTALNESKALHELRRYPTAMQREVKTSQNGHQRCENKKLSPRIIVLGRGRARAASSATKNESLLPQTGCLGALTNLPLLALSLTLRPTQILGLRHRPHSTVGDRLCRTARLMFTRTNLVTHPNFSPNQIDPSDGSTGVFILPPEAGVNLVIPHECLNAVLDRRMGHEKFRDAAHGLVGTERVGDIKVRSRVVGVLHRELVCANLLER